MRFFKTFMIALGLTVGTADLATATPVRAVGTYVQWSGAGGDRLVPLENVFAMLRARYTGDPIGKVAKRTGPEGAIFYEVMWLTGEGRKLVFLVDARTGQVVSTKGAN